MDVCEITAKILLCITLKNGHCLILGSDGKGRNCLARLGCFLTGHKMFDAGINQDYSLQLWRDDLKKVLMFCGVERMQVNFLLSDKRIISESMLEDLSRLLTSAELISLYNEKDQEEILTSCKQECLKIGKKPTR